MTEKNNMIMISIVAIVAIVGLFLVFANNGTVTKTTSTELGGNLAGQAYSHYSSITPNSGASDIGITPNSGASDIGITPNSGASDIGITPSNEKDLKLKDLKLKDLKSKNLQDSYSTSFQNSKITTYGTPSTGELRVYTHFYGKDAQGNLIYKKNIMLEVPSSNQGIQEDICNNNEINPLIKTFFDCSGYTI